MAFITKILRTIWAIYALIILFIVLLIYTPVCFLGLLFFGKSAERPLISFGYRYVAGLIFLGWGIIVKTKKKYLVNKNKAYVIVANHRNYLDAFSSELASPVPFKFLSKIENGRIPLFGYIIRNLCILINRKSEASRQEGYERMKASLSENFSVLVFPEGTRNKTDQPLKEFYDGAFKLAIETNTPIAVLTLLNNSELMNIHRKLDLRPGIIRTVWASPIETSHLNLEDLDALKEEIRQIMLSNLGLASGRAIR